MTRIANKERREKQAKEQKIEQTITGRALLAGVVGYPVSHSLSPVLHNYWLRRYGIDGAYVPLPVAPETFETALYGLQAAGFRGVNVTIPHKESAYKIATIREESAQQIGSVNTLLFEANGDIRGLSTDGSGFIASLEGKVKNLEQCRILVLGAGGAARSIIGALLVAGACVHVTNHRQERAAQLSAVFPQITIIPWAEWEQALGAYDLLINTTPLGMEGGKYPYFCPSLREAKPNLVVADIVYTPLETPLLRAATKQGLQTVEGLGMLLHQARLGFLEWFGVNPQVDSQTWAHVKGHL